MANQAEKTTAEKKNSDATPPTTTKIQSSGNGGKHEKQTPHKKKGVSMIMCPDGVLQICTKPRFSPIELNMKMILCGGELFQSDCVINHHRRDVQKISANDIEMTVELHDLII